jgi:hypothetical protein
MEKRFSKIEISSIKTIAKNVTPYVNKKNKVDEKIKEIHEKVEEMIRKRVEEKVAKLEAEKAGYQAIIDSMNATVKHITGGYTTEDLVNREVVKTGKLDQNGKEILQTRYTLKYPETVVPVLEEKDFDESATEEAEEVEENPFTEEVEENPAPTEYDEQAAADDNDEWDF